MLEFLFTALVVVVLLFLSMIVVPTVKKYSGLEYWVKAAIAYAETQIQGDKVGGDRREYVYNFLRKRFKWFDEKALRLLIQGTSDIMDKEGLVNVKEGVK